MKGETKKKVLLALIAIVPATVSGVLSNCQARYEARAKAKSAETNSVGTTLESLKPAIKELQDIQKKNSEWARGINKDHHKMDAHVDQLRKDVEYCKAYIDFATRGKYKEKYVPAYDPVASAIEIVDDVMGDRPPPAPRTKARLPSNAKQAKAYQGARVQMKCAPGDPLCGAAALR